MDVIFIYNYRSAGCVIFELVAFEKYDSVNNLEKIKDFSKDLNELLEM